MKTKLDPKALRWCARQLGYKMLSPVGLPLTDWGRGYNAGLLESQRRFTAEARAIEAENSRPRRRPAGAAESATEGGVMATVGERVEDENPDSVTNLKRRIAELETTSQARLDELQRIARALGVEGSMLTGYQAGRIVGELRQRIAELEAAGLALVEVLSEYEAQWGDDYLAEKWGLREEAAGPRAVFSPPNQQPKEE